MLEIGPEHPITYREELLQPLFQRVRAGESAAVVGAASMGKSRLLQFMLRPDVQEQYLGEQHAATFLLWVDCNRLVEISHWALYELMLTSLVEAARGRGVPPELWSELNTLRRDAIVGGNGLLAQRHLELAVQMLCREHKLSLCIMLDEFDECLSDLPAQALAGLRALRDANKYQLAFVLLVRDAPERLRDPLDYEGFYELFSRAVLGLKPYGDEDARRMLAQIAARRGHELKSLPDSVQDEVLGLSGGHPGLLVAMLDALTHSWPIGQPWLEWAMANAGVEEELRKLWMGLRPDERRLLNQEANLLPTEFRARTELIAKGLLVEAGPQQIDFFSPLLAQCARVSAPLAATPLQIDLAAGLVFVNNKQTVPLTPKEFDLLVFLHSRHGEICSVDEILERLYGMDPDGAENSSVTTLIRRLRQKIEPIPKRPIYIVNQRGRGYCLHLDPK